MNETRNAFHRKNYAAIDSISFSVNALLALLKKLDSRNKALRDARYTALRSALLRQKRRREMTNEPTILDRIGYGLNQFCHAMLTGEWWRGNIYDYMRLPR